jgi:dTMP kinase
MTPFQAKFITLEGIDGAGKSTHLAWIGAFLGARRIPHRITREPGGTPLGERLRALLLDPEQPVDPGTEALLMFAARHEHLAQVIRPALAAGEWVICDRFTDATYAYQGAGRGVSQARLAALEAWVQEALQPDVTLYFDVPVELARTRRDGVRAPDRFEREREAFFERVRQGYLSRAARYPERIRVIDATLPLDEVRAQLEAILVGLTEP